MLNRKGQSTLEYALIIAVVVAGLLLMQHYVKRGYAGRLKSASDEMGEQYDPAAYTGKFEVKNYSYTKQTNTAGTTETKYQDLSGAGVAGYAGQGQVSVRKTKEGEKETISAWGEDEQLFKK